jgi:hypothetical protein
MVWWSNWSLRSVVNKQELWGKYVLQLRGRRAREEAVASVYGYTGTLGARNQLKHRSGHGPGGGCGKCIRVHWYTTSSLSVR